MLIAGLQWWVAVRDARTAAREEAAAASEPPTTARILDRAPAPDTGAGARHLLDLLPGTADRFHLATIDDQLPPGCAPVLRVVQGGAIQMVEAPPVAAVPGPLRYPDVGILLPQARVCDLTAAERSSLLRIWGRLAGTQGLTADRVRAPGCRFQEGELALLLRWLR